MDILEENEVLEDDLDILEVVQEGLPRRIWERSDYFQEMDDLSFFKRFRLTKPTVLRILEQIDEQMEYPSDRNNSVTPMNQLLTCLRLYATGGHLSSIADFIGMDTSTASRIVERVSPIIANLRPQYVYMPVGQESIEVQNKFFNMNSFPRVEGVIDGTHIRMQSPGGEDPLVFINRKGYYSLNVQVIGDADLKIRDIVARWPGSAHDQTILNNSRIRARFEQNEFPNTALLGDSGYALRNYLLTPVQNAQTPGEQLYNEAHVRTRNAIERLIGVWKRRFPILAYGIRLKLETALAIIPATAVLHNIAREQNEDVPPDDEDNDIQLLNYLIEMGNIEELPEAGDINQLNNVTRNSFINYFETMGVRNRDIEH